VWPFRNRPLAADVTAKQLREEFAELKVEVRSLQMEWERTYDKLRGIVARMSRRNGEIEDPAAAPAAPGKPVSRPLRDPATVSPILQRRNY